MRNLTNSTYLIQASYMVIIALIHLIPNLKLRSNITHTVACYYKQHIMYTVSC